MFVKTIRILTERYNELDVITPQVEQAVEGIPVTMRGLDENHDLWVLGGPKASIFPLERLTFYPAGFMLKSTLSK